MSRDCGRLVKLNHYSDITNSLVSIISNQFLQNETDIQNGEIIDSYRSLIQVCINVVLNHIKAAISPEVINTMDMIDENETC